MVSMQKYATGPEILAKMSQNVHVWFGDLDFGTFWLIFQDLMHIFKINFAMKS